MNNKPKRFIECLLPVTLCNLECEYCYIIQEGRRGLDLCTLNYPIEQIVSALSPTRMGGVCYINICGSGETLIPSYIVELTHGLLKSGHFVSITTNGTLTERFLQFVKEIEPNFLKHLHFAFSFHYIELKKRNMLDVFFNNIKLVRSHGCSFVCQLNLYDGYFPFVSEIKAICKKEIGSYPQVAVTRKEGLSGNEIMSSNYNEYIRVGKSFESPLFDFTLNNFNIKRTEFCYAGDWSFLLNLKTGEMRKCYHCEKTINIFDNPNKPIKFEALGSNCRHFYCVNSSHFMSLGIIPSINAPSYVELRNRSNASWYTEEMKSFLNSKLYENNDEYPFFKKLITNIRNKKEKSIKRRIKEWYWSLSYSMNKCSSKKHLKKILKSDKNRNIYSFSQWPHTNIGDAAIYLAQDNIIKKSGFSQIEITPAFYYQNKEAIVNYLNTNNTFVCLQGGGNIGSLWKEEEQHRRDVLTALPNAIFLIFPQSIFFENEDDIKESIQYYNKETITIMLRDEKSFSFAKKHYPKAKLILTTDIVFSLHFPRFHKKRNKALFILRNDKEKIIDLNQKNEIIECFSNLRIDFTDMHNTKAILPSIRKKIVKKKAAEIAKYRYVITDRLHAMIFSVMTDTHCFVFDNIYGKIKGVMDTACLDKTGIVEQITDGRTINLDCKDVFLPFNRKMCEDSFIKAFKEWIKNA